MRLGLNHLLIATTVFCGAIAFAQSSSYGHHVFPYRHPVILIQSIYFGFSLGFLMACLTTRSNEHDDLFPMRDWLALCLVLLALPTTFASNHLLVERSASIAEPVPWLQHFLTFCMLPAMALLLPRVHESQVLRTLSLIHISEPTRPY